RWRSGWSAGEGWCSVLHSPSVAWLPGQLPLGVGDFSCSWLLATTRPAGRRRAVAEWVVGR
ncbi:hypothetical protein ACIRBX_13430, partial [Kitasatospora sp. NPDC096147]|uniref:hypothetical protein n=1 Tax=Kitasatospora sp. NPDC096147 TaxID=3364093 RepID=UPI00380C1CD1